MEGVEGYGGEAEEEEEEAGGGGGCEEGSWWLGNEGWVGHFSKAVQVSEGDDGNLNHNTMIRSTVI